MLLSQQPITGWFMVTQNPLSEHIEALVTAASGGEGVKDFEEEELLQLVIDFANEGKLGGPLMRLAKREPSLELRALQRRLRKDLAATIGGGLSRSDLQRLISAARQ